MQTEHVMLVDILTVCLAESRLNLSKTKVLTTETEPLGALGTPSNIIAEIIGAEKHVLHIMSKSN